MPATIPTLNRPVTRPTTVLLVVLLLAPGLNVHAAIVSLTGDLVAAPAPASVLDGALESNVSMLVFSERSGYVLAAEVDAVLALPSLSFAGDAIPSAGTIGTGSPVDSWLVHADRIGAAWSSRMSGSVTFDSDILAVIVRSSNLAATDAELGAAGTLYGTDAYRGIDDANDTIAISADRRTLTLALRHSTLDNLRVVTAAALADASPVPLPASLLLLPAALFVLLRSRRATDGHAAPPVST